LEPKLGVARAEDGDDVPRQFVVGVIGPVWACGEIVRM
jgi:hypothetical protein